ATIKSTSQQVGIQARDVRAIVEQEHPESTLTQRDIYNARALVTRDILRGYASTAALLKEFNKKEIPYVVKWSPDEPNRLLGLVWTFPYCIQMWKRFPEVISFNNTYNTNRFKLPLFQVTGQTCLGTVFNAAFGLIDNERRDGFQFLAKSISTLLSQHSIRQPAIIITDFDDSMKAALNDQFAEVQQQLCIHHINSNVLLRSKQKWVKNAENSSSSDISDADEPAEPQATLTLHDRALISAETSSEVPHTYQGVLQMWKQVLFAETEEAHKKAWIALCKEFDDQRPILRYLFNTYMPFRAQWARCFIRKYPNYGIRVTSGTEASNNNIKSYLLNGMGHLHNRGQAMQDMLYDQERDFKDACGNDEVLRDREFLGSSSDYLGELRSIASSKCLKLINIQYRLAHECSVSTELGIPCYHTVQSRRAAEEYEAGSTSISYALRSISAEQSGLGISATSISVSRAWIPKEKAWPPTWKPK
ncbi:mutator-like element, partial [Fusarium flagelliforme]